MSATTTSFDEAAAPARKLTKAQARSRKAAVHRMVRFGVQILFLVLAPGVFSTALNGVKYVAGQIGALDVVEPVSFVVTLVLVLALTFLFGRFFCGYVCAFGTCCDIVYELGAPVRKLFRLEGKRLNPRVARGMQMAKYVVLIAILAVCFVGAASYLSWVDPWTAFAGLLAGNVEGIYLGAFVALGLIAAGSLVQERFFCQNLCPMGAVFSLIPQLPLGTYSRCNKACSARCSKCQQACPVGIYPDAEGLAAGECIACGRCADVCPTANIVPAIYAGESPAKGAREKKSKRRFNGTGPGWVLLKAVVFLAALWVMGALRFVPGFEQVFLG